MYGGSLGLTAAVEKYEGGVVLSFTYCYFFIAFESPGYLFWGTKTRFCYFICRGRVTGSLNYKMFINPPPFHYGFCLLSASANTTQHLCRCVLVLMYMSINFFIFSMLMWYQFCRHLKRLLINNSKKFPIPILSICLSTDSQKLPPCSVAQLELICYSLHF